MSQLLLAPLLPGLASAASLFLVAYGISLVFCVTRTVNFAHGAFYRLGAYVAYTVTDRFSASSFWPAVVAATLIVAALGALVEMRLLRRIYDAPELFQRLATVRVTLMVEHLVGLGAALFGRLAVTLSGVNFALLTLAFSQIVWSMAFQSVEVTGGDNSIVGVWPPAYIASARGFFWLTVLLAAPALVVLQALIFSPFGYALRAKRHSELRAEALGMERVRVQAGAFVGAGLAGGLKVYLKDGAFPDSLGIPLSVEGLAMVLIGGVETALGPIVGAIAFKALSIGLIGATDYSKLALGAIILGGVAAAPRGLVSALALWPRSVRA